MSNLIKNTLIASALIASGTVAEAAGAFKLTSPDIVEGRPLAMAHVANVFGCSGGNISPALEWSGAPEGTKSFVVTAYDPDAPTGSGFWHWSIANIPVSITKLAGGITPNNAPAGSVQVRNDYGFQGFGGACPPPGRVHRYIFSVYALKVEKLDVTPETTPAVIGFMTLANAIGKASITALYGR